MLTDEAADAVQTMEAHEERRDGKYSTGGDDHSAGVDTNINANAPKELDLPPNKRGST